jgi:hypothetical protein
MTRVKHEISEHDVVALRESFDNRPAGTVGTAVSDYHLGMFLVEFNDPEREFLDNIVPVPADQLVLQQRWPS